MAIPSVYQAKAAAIIPMFTGSFSIIGTSIVLYIIFRSHVRLSTTYHRLLLGLCISDLFQSLNFAVSSLPAPSDASPTVPFAIGNQMTCNAQGFLGTFGKTSLTLYYCGLSGYFLLSIKTELTEESIKKYYEPFVHFISIGYGLIGSIIVWIYNGFYTTANTCWIAPKPFHCDKNPNIECIRGQHFYEFQWAVLGWPIIISFIIIAVNMFIIFVALLQQNQTHHITVGVTGNNQHHHQCQDRNDPTSLVTSTPQSNSNIVIPEEQEETSERNMDGSAGEHLVDTTDEEEAHHEEDNGGTESDIDRGDQRQNEINAQPSTSITTYATESQRIMELYAASKQENKKKSRAERDREEGMIQALLYILSFFLCYSIAFIYHSLAGKSSSVSSATTTMNTTNATIVTGYEQGTEYYPQDMQHDGMYYNQDSEEAPPFIIFILSKIFMPLGGVFNCLIFLRPTVVNLLRRDSTISLWKAIKTAIQSRGQPPEMRRRRSSFATRRHSVQSTQSQQRCRSSTTRSNSVFLPSVLTPTPRRPSCTAASVLHHTPPSTKRSSRVLFADSPEAQLSIKSNNDTKTDSGGDVKSNTGVGDDDENDNGDEKMGLVNRFKNTLSSELSTVDCKNDTPKKIGGRGKIDENDAEKDLRVPIISKKLEH